MSDRMRPIVAFVFLAGCSKSGREWVVLPEKEAVTLMSPCSRSFPPDLVGYWDLGDAEIQRAEIRFLEALKLHLRRIPKDEREDVPGRWNAQYAGFHRHGRKVVYVNAVADGVAEDWRKRAIRICDGGLISFGAVLDLDRDSVDSFEFNGTVGGPIPLGDAAGPDAVQP